MNGFLMLFTPSLVYLPKRKNIRREKKSKKV